MKVLFNGYTLKMAYTSQDPINTTLNIQQARRAKNYGSVELRKDIGSLSLGLRVNRSGARRNSDFSEQRLDAFTVTNLYLTRQLNSEWTARLLVENVTDEQYEIAGGYNTPRRGVFLSLQYQAR